MRAHLSIAASLLLLAGWSPAQSVELAGGKYPMVKAENGLIIGWNIFSEDREKPQVRVFDHDGKLLVELTPLRLASEAKDATIHDVSALQGHVIAVEATYRKAPNTVPDASLLGFDFKGNPLFAVALTPSRSVRYLTVEADSNIWTLTGGSGEKEGSADPMMVGYRPSGDVLKEVLKRSEFPSHELGIQENDTIGVSALGHTSNGIWFWLPGSTDLVTCKSDGSSPMRTVTGLPEKSAGEIPIKVLLSDAGDLLVQMSGSQNPDHIRHSGVFVLRAKTKAWETFQPPCDRCLLIGIDHGQAVFSKHNGSGFDIYSAPLPQ